MATLALIGYYIWNCLSTLSSRLTTCCNSVPLNCPCWFGFCLLRGLAFLVTLVWEFDIYFSLSFFWSLFWYFAEAIYTAYTDPTEYREVLFKPILNEKSALLWIKKQTNKKKTSSKPTVSSPAFLAGYGVTLLELQNSQAKMVFCNLQASWSKSRITRQPVLHKGTFWGAWMSWPTLCISTSW